MPDATVPMQHDDDDHNAAKRLLKKLRIALIVWVVVFVMTIVWFTLSATT